VLGKPAKQVPVYSQGRGIRYIDLKKRCLEVLMGINENSENTIGIGKSTWTYEESWGMRDRQTQRAVKLVSNTNMQWVGPDNPRDLFNPGAERVRGCSATSDDKVRSGCTRLVSTLRVSSILGIIRLTVVKTHGPKLRYLQDVFSTKDSTVADDLLSVPTLHHSQAVVRLHQSLRRVRRTSVVSAMILIRRFCT